jgi:DNA-binding MarR family transcriptional regulator
MLDKMSNASRLVDKLLNKSYVIRTFRKDDRRACDVMISPKGVEFLSIVNADMERTMATLNTLDTSELETLNSLLDKFRETCD